MIMSAASQSLTSHGGAHGHMAKLHVKFTVQTWASCRGKTDHQRLLLALLAFKEILHAGPEARASDPGNIKFQE
jgi:hypothetical protein